MKRWKDKGKHDGGRGGESNEQTERQERECERERGERGRIIKASPILRHQLRAQIGCCSLISVSRWLTF